VTTAIQQHPAAPGWAIHPDLPVEWDRLRRLALVAAAGGVAAFVVLGVLLYFAGGLTSPQQYFLSYLVAFIYWVGISAGSLVLLMIQYLSGGAWGLVLRRVFEAAARILPFGLVLAVPLIITVFMGDYSLYPWAHHAEAAELGKKVAYLNAPFWTVRTVIYFGIWTVLAYFLTRWAAIQDQGPLPPGSMMAAGDGHRQLTPGAPGTGLRSAEVDAETRITAYPPPGSVNGEGLLQFQRRFRLLSGPGLALYGLCITFGSIDWGMSLEPHWYSTMYPLLFAVGQLLNAMAFGVVTILLLSRRAPLADAVNRSHRRDFGSLLLTFVMFWGYMAICQFLLIFAENLPEEVPWYLRRSYGAWKVPLVLIFVFHFVVPFLLLLSRDVKQNPRTLLGAAGLLLVMRFVDIFWWIEPSYIHDGQYAFWLLDLAALVGVGGAWLYLFLGLLRSRPLLPLRDPYLTEALTHEYPD
jgi:hypothetical protein